MQFPLGKCKKEKAEYNRKLARKAAGVYIIFTIYTIYIIESTRAQLKRKHGFTWICMYRNLFNINPLHK